MKANKIDLAGLKFGKWTVLKEHGIYEKSGAITWMCICECGNTGIRQTSILKNNKSLSCGCLQKEVARLNVKHGGAVNGTETPEYRSFRHMKTRCYSTKYKQYSDYGGRGISVCERWLDKENGFLNFISDMGNRPSINHTLERRENDGNYDPYNCYWGTKKEQSRNRRQNRYFEYNGETLVLTDWAAKLGVHMTSIHYYLKKGKSFSEVFEYFNNKNKAA